MSTNWLGMGGQSTTLEGCIHSLDWTAGLEHWIELFSFFGQVSVFIFRNKPSYTFLQSTIKYLATMDDCNKKCVVVYCSVFSST